VPRLTHLSEQGTARMVDVADRERTARSATATARVLTTPDVLATIASGAAPKGDVAAVARVAGIQATKATPALIPLCHPIAIHGAQVDVEVGADAVLVSATVRTVDRTGVEMEALTAVAVAGLTVIDMIKTLDPAASLTDVRVEAKDGGRSGAWSRP
jgi:cyclic pyranopterin phosphate synthase